MKLMTIGDSLSQGVMSIATGKTEFSYSTLIAEKLGLSTDNSNHIEYGYPVWGSNGIPLDIEIIVRAVLGHLSEHLKDKPDNYQLNILDAKVVLTKIEEIVDVVEDFYERGEGSLLHRYIPESGQEVEYFHNMAISGYTVADTWLLDSKICKREIRNDVLNAILDQHVFLGGIPNKFFYRVAHTVLNPSHPYKRQSASPETDSAIGWLNYHASNEGVENLILWLGGNHALGTVARLKVNETDGNVFDRPLNKSTRERRDAGWNLWEISDFVAEYKELMQRVDEAMSANKTEDWKVFIGTIPKVTIAPIIKGIGNAQPRSDEDPSMYYDYYQWVFLQYFSDDFQDRFTTRRLNRDAAQAIDDRIVEYNTIISTLAAEYNTKHGIDRYIVVDMASRLEDLAYKRNDGQPTYEYPAGFQKGVKQTVDTRYYATETANGVTKLTAGGIFSLDGIHPTAIGQGLIAHEFLGAINHARNLNLTLTAEDWERIAQNEKLYAEPISFEDIEKLAEAIESLIELIRLNKERPRWASFVKRTNLPDMLKDMLADAIGN